MRLRAVLGLLALGLATACGSDSDSDSGDSGPVTLTLWTRAATEAVSKARSLPDLFAADVVFAPQNASQGLWLDVTDRFQALALFSEADKALSDGNTAITESLQQGS